MGSEADYGAGVFAPSDFGRLARRLSAIAGRFMLSVNDVPETRAAFAAFAIEPVSTKYTISGRWMDVAEILVTGLDCTPEVRHDNLGDRHSEDDLWQQEGRSVSFRRLTS